MAGIMFSSYQKFYSALSNLERFYSSNNFYDNISSLDSFFSEYRNITFVLQSEIGKKEKKEIYERNRNKYLKDCKWFNDERVKTVHKHPFKLIKRIDIKEYSKMRGDTISNHVYSVENDEPLDSLLDSIKQQFSNCECNEIFFSVIYSFYEENDEQGIFDKLIPGVIDMYDFLKTMYNELGEQCDLCKILDEKINKLIAKVSFVEGRLVADYIYYPTTKKFERGSMMQLLLPQSERIPICGFCSNFQLDKNSDLFEKIIFMNLIIGRVDLMPTFMIVYKDDTFTLDSFHSDIKTTFYRKFNNVAEIVDSKEVQEIYFMGTYSTIPILDETMRATSKERIKNSMCDLLTFIRIGKGIQEECIFDEEIIKDKRKMFFNMKYGRKKTLCLGKNNMQPIIRAFESEQ